MKRILSVLAIFVMAAGAAGAQAVLSSAAPKDARTMALGGAFVAMSDGYQSLYGNPASFADKKGELTLVSFNPWVYVRPTTDNLDAFQTILSGDGDMTALAGPLGDLISENGFGAGLSGGLGWVGKGLGLGLIASGEAYLSGNTLLGASGNADAQIAGVVGIGVPFQLGPFRLQVGGDIRPYLRMTGEVYATDLLGSVLGSGDEFDAMALPVDVGFGLALDLGAKLELGKLVSVGLAVRDISTNQTYVRDTLANVLAGLQSGGLPDGEQVEYALTPNLTLGAAVTPIPSFLRKLVDVTVLAELQDPISVFQDIQESGNSSALWKLFHVGVETDLLGGLLAARFGVNKGWISLGAGLDLLILELNVALFTEEMGIVPGDSPRTGMAAEVTIRL